MVGNVLHRPTLLLNRSWHPVDVTPVARALVLVWNEVARIIDPETYQQFDWADWAALVPDDDEPAIHTVDRRIRVPEVVSLKQFNRVPRVHVPFNRRNLYKRDHFTCQYCGKRPGSKELTIDHVLPRSRGGKSCWENCVLACTTCNRRKADKAVDACGLRLRTKPVRPIWQPMYGANDMRIESWSKFLSEAYWTVPLEP